MKMKEFVVENAKKNSTSVHKLIILKKKEKH